MRSAIFLLAYGLAASCSAACFDLKSLNAYPSNDQVEMFLDIEGLAQKDEALKRDIDKQFDQGHAPMLVPRHPPEQDQYLPEPTAFSWMNFLDPRKYDGGKFRPLGKEPAGLDDQRGVYFYEPDGRGGRRVCRVEVWRPRGNPQHHGYLAEYQEPTLQRWPKLKAMTGLFGLQDVHLYFYDADNRITEWRWHESDYFSETKPYAVRDTLRLSKCYIRDAKGRLTRFVQQIDDGTKTCATADRETASFMDYRYDSDGRYAGSVQNMPGNTLLGDTSPHWSLIYRLHPTPATYVEAEANSWWGLHWLTGMPQIEDVPDRKVPDDKLRAPYRFPDGAPISVMDNLPHSIKAHRRIREGPLGPGGTVSEMFPPNGGLTDRIYWRTSDGTVFRHERFKNGKPIQFVNDTILLNDKGESQYYPEDLQALDRVLKHPKINVPRENVRLRVYKVDANGQQTLVALSWSKALPDMASTRMPTREESVKALWNLVRGQKQPKSPTPSDEDLRVRYTDPQGKEIWRDWDQFLKVTRYVENINAFFPRGTPPRSPPAPLPASAPSARAK